MSLSLLSRPGNAEAVDTSSIHAMRSQKAEGTRETISYATPPSPRKLSLLQFLAVIAFRIVGLGYVFFYLPYCFISS